MVTLCAHHELLFVDANFSNRSDLRSVRNNKADLCKGKSYAVLYTIIRIFVLNKQFVKNNDNARHIPTDLHRPSFSLKTVHCSQGWIKN